MIIDYDNRYFNVNLMSIGLKTIGFVGLFASTWDGLMTAGVSLLVFIYDAIRHPYPSILDVTEEMKEEMKDDVKDNDDDIKPV